MDRRPPVQVFLGVLIVAVGVIALLTQLDVITVNLGQLVADWWPLAVIGVGLAALVTVPRAWLGPTVIVAVGVFFLLQTLDIVDINIWQFLWPVAIILVGLSLITSFGSRSTDDDTINSTVFWWGSQRRTRSRQFKGGSLTAIMGGIEVDLREADIVGTAQIAVFVLWGGVEIKVPPTWRVRTSGLPLMGGWDDKTTLPLEDGAPELVVHVTAIMGGAEIKSDAVPSYRVTAAIGLLQPGVAAPDVLPQAVATAEAMTTVEAHDVAVVRGQARVTVRFQADDDQTARRVGWAVLARLDELADISGRSVTRRFGSRWYPVRAQSS